MPCNMNVTHNSIVVLNEDQKSLQLNYKIIYETKLKFYDNLNKIFREVLCKKFG